MIVGTKRFDANTDLSALMNQEYTHFAIEVNHPTTIRINGNPFKIGYNLILEFDKCTITSLTDIDQSVEGIITYEKEGS